jgi:hypothetical protein
MAIQPLDLPRRLAESRELYDYFFPTCEHGLSAQLCAGPGHYPADM